MAKREIKFSIPKEKALKISKKAATEKFGILKDSGFKFKVGAPMMTATVSVEDGVVYVSGGGFGKVVVNTVFNYISNALGEADDVDSQAASQAPKRSLHQTTTVDEQLKIVEAIKAYKELLDSDIITQEEFEAKKKELMGVPTVYPSNDNCAIEPPVSIREDNLDNHVVVEEDVNDPQNNTVLETGRSEDINLSQNESKDIFGIMDIIAGITSLAYSVLNILAFFAIQSRLSGHLWSWSFPELGIFLGAVATISFLVVWLVFKVKQNTVSNNASLKTLLILVLVLLAVAGIGLTGVFGLYMLIKWNFDTLVIVKAILIASTICYFISWLVFVFKWLKSLVLMEE